LNRSFLGKLWRNIFWMNYSIDGRCRSSFGHRGRGRSPWCFLQSIIHRGSFLLDFRSRRILCRKIFWLWFQKNFVEIYFRICFLKWFLEMVDGARPSDSHSRTKSNVFSTKFNQPWSLPSRPSVSKVSWNRSLYRNFVEIFRNRFLNGSFLEKLCRNIFGWIIPSMIDVARPSDIAVADEVHVFSTKFMSTSLFLPSRPSVSKGSWKGSLFRKTL